MGTHTEPQASFLVLDFRKEAETRACLESIRRNAQFPHKIVYLDNGADASTNYPGDLYREGLCDVIIRKRVGRGGGFGQSDLFRWCDTQYAIFVQNDQELLHPIYETTFQSLIAPFSQGYQCVDLNGDQSGRGVWTDRAHLVETRFFNSLAPFPNGGPGNDAAEWNEAYLQRVFAERGYRIAHLRQALFADCGKWSVREAGDGLFKHRCDLKTLYVLKKPTYRTEVYPPLSNQEWDLMLSGQWVDGTIPEAWKAHSFRHWPD